MSLTPSPYGCDVIYGQNPKKLEERRDGKNSLAFYLVSVFLNPREISDLAFFGRGRHVCQSKDFTDKVLRVVARQHLEQQLGTRRRAVEGQFKNYVESYKNRLLF